MNNLRFAVRQLTKAPGFTAVAILSLALGIGGNTAIFSVLNALLLKPLPYPESDRLVQVAEVVPNAGFNGCDGGVYSDWETQTTLLESIAALHPVSKNFATGSDPVRISGAEVTQKYLHVLGIKPVLGRDFLPEEDAPGGNRHVTILSSELWDTRFQRDPGVIGRTVNMDGESFTVIGVLPPRALINPTISFLTPAAIRAEAYKQVPNYNYVCFVIGRLKPGVTIEAPGAELAAARSQVVSKYPSFRQSWTVGTRSLQEALFGGARPFALTLLGAVGAVLLIACANVGNLLVARAATRQGEMAVRVALGASTGQLLRQLMTESMLLATLGGTAGLLLGAWAIHPLVVFTQLDVNAPGLIVNIDGRVFAFTLGATVVTGVLFGLFPALAAARPNVNDSLKESVRGSTSGSRRRLQSLLIISESALTVVLLVCAGLLIRSFFTAAAAATGFDRERVLVFTVAQPGTKAPTIDHRIRFIREVESRVGVLPGVENVGVASSMPMGNRGYGEFVSREEKPETRNDVNAGFDSADGAFFQALGVPLLRGRYFTDADCVENAARVMIINQALARRLFSEEDPIGRLLNWKNQTWQVVGVVGDVRQFRLDIDPVPHLFVPFRHFPWSTTVAVRTRGVSPLSLADDLRRAVQSIDPEQPISELTTLDAAAEATLQPRRIMLTLVSLFAGIALLLAAVGIYGVMAYSVAQRTREIGIRMALGAGLAGVVKLVLHEGVRLVAIGIGIGAVVSFGAARLIASQLYATSQTDPIVLLTVAVTLVMVALLACWIPARRATLVNPVEALRAE